MHRIELSSSHLTGHEIKFIKEAIHLNQISSHGFNLVNFETDLENYLNNDKHVACLSSGTAAIHLALVQLGVSKDDEVICQSFTFCGSANPIIYQGATPIFVDSELDTWNMSPIHLEKAIKSRLALGKKPKAIIIVHLYGMPAKMEELIHTAQKYEIPIIEDAAEALGSTYKGQKCGTLGTYGVLSFNGNKIITTSGGGALVCNTKEEKNKTVFYATQARDNSPHYQHSKIGYNYRMSNISGSIGRGQMEVLDKHVRLRQKMNVFYQKIFDKLQGVTVFKEPSEEFISNHWLTCITIDNSCIFSISQLQMAMNNAKIETRPLWKPMHLQPVFDKYPYYGNNESKELFYRGLCLPSGSNLSDNDRERIVNTIDSII